MITTRADSATAASDAASVLSACSSGRSARAGRCSSSRRGPPRACPGCARPAPSAGPAGACCGEVGGGELAGEAGGAEDDDVVVAACARLAQLTPGVGRRGRPFSPSARPGTARSGAASHPHGHSRRRRPSAAALISTLAIGGMVAGRTCWPPRPRCPGATRWRRPPRRRRCAVRRLRGPAHWYVDDAVDRSGPWGWGGRCGGRQTATRRRADAAVRQARVRPVERGGQRRHRHQHPGGRGRRARRRQDRRPDRRTLLDGRRLSSPTSPGPSPAGFAVATARRSSTPTACCSWATTCW